MPHIFLMTNKNSLKGSLNSFMKVKTLDLANEKRPESDRGVAAE